MATGTESPRRGPGIVWTLARRTVRDALRDRLPGLAAEVAFYTVLALPPLSLVLLGSLGFVTGWLGEGAKDGVRDAIFDAANTFLSPSTVTDLVEPAVDGLLARGRLDVLTIGAVIALWSASRATRVIIDAITIAYDRQPARTWWQRRLVAFGLTAAGIIAVVVLLPLLVVGPEAGVGIADRVGFGRAFEVTWAVLYWPVVAGIGLVLLTWVYHLVEPDSPWRWELPGAALALVIWAAGSFAVRLYATTFIEGDSAYGVFAAPLVVLLWVYVAASAVLLGAELNAEIDKLIFDDAGASQ